MKVLTTMPFSVFFQNFWFSGENLKIYYTTRKDIDLALFINFSAGIVQKL